MKLKFELQAYESKLNYLISLRKGKVEEEYDIDIKGKSSSFYREVEDSKNSLDKQYGTIEWILDNYAKQSILRMNISHLQGEI